MAEAEQSWDDRLKEWLIDTSACYSASMGNIDDSNVVAYWAAANTDGAGSDDAWATMYKDGEYEVPITNEDGSEGTAWITEMAKMAETLTQCRCSNGMYCGGMKFNIGRFDKELETSDKAGMLTWILGQAPGGKEGLHICLTPNWTWIAGKYNEDKGQTAGNAKKGVVDMAEWLVQSGY